MKEEVRVTGIRRDQSAIAKGETDDKTIKFLGKQQSTESEGSALSIGVTLKGDPKAIDEIAKKLNVERLNDVITVQLFPNKQQRLEKE